MENKYQKCEKIGRKYTKKLCEQYNWEYSFVDDNNFSVYDSFVKAGGKNCMVEIKVRKKEWPDYILEDLKLRELEDAVKKTSEKIDKVLYFVWISDKICYVFNLGDVVDGKLIRNENLPLKDEDKRIDKNFNAHTVESTEHKIPKWVYYLLPNDAIKYEKQTYGLYKKIGVKEV